MLSSGHCLALSTGLSPLTADGELHKGPTDSCRCLVFTRQKEHDSNTGVVRVS
jgi:hypothetical protein